MLTCEVSSCDRPASDGKRLCFSCLNFLYEDIRLIVDIYNSLEHALTAKGSQNDKVSGTQESKGLSLNQAALDARVDIFRRVYRWVVFIVEQKKITSVTIMSPMETIVALINSNKEWLVKFPDKAGLFAEDVREIVHGKSWRVLNPSLTRVFVVGQCPKVGVSGRCKGSVTAVLRQIDNSLPSGLVCDVDSSHVWRSSEWLQLGQHMARMGLMV